MHTAAKIAILGSGHVGSHVASECIRQGLAREVVLLDKDRSKARGHAADLRDAAAYYSNAAHVYEGWYEKVADADLAVMCACATGYESADRLNELAPTLKVADEVIAGLTSCGFSGILVSISNPCDIIAQYLQKKTSLTVIGTGTALDSARFRVRLARALQIDVSAVQGYCLGEHGDSQVPALGTVTIGGLPLKALMSSYPGIDFEGICRDTVTAGWDIVMGKGCTEFGIGSAAARLIRAILNDEQAILPCSVMLSGIYGGEGIYASVPCRVCKTGAVPMPEFELDQKERLALTRSFQVIKSHLPKEII
jgi:L-lactate dehydrogenase